MAEQNDRRQHREQRGCINPGEKTALLHHAGHGDADRNRDYAQHRKQDREPDLLLEHRSLRAFVLCFPVANAGVKGDRHGEQYDNEQMNHRALVKRIAGWQEKQQVEHGHRNHSVAEVSRHGVQHEALLHLLEKLEGHGRIGDSVGSRI